MPTYTKPAFEWDGEKFRARYGLEPMDFYDDGEGNIVVKQTLPEPVIFDPPTPRIERERTLAKDLLLAGVSAPIVLKAAVAVLIDELNNHANKINAILSAVDAATSLADLKTRVAAITDYPQRTLSQAKTSINNKIDTGEAD